MSCIEGSNPSVSANMQEKTALPGPFAFASSVCALPCAARGESGRRHLNASSLGAHCANVRCRRIGVRCGKPLPPAIPACFVPTLRSRSRSTAPRLRSTRIVPSPVPIGTGASVCFGLIFDRGGRVERAARAGRADKRAPGCQTRHRSPREVLLRFALCAQQ